MQEKQEKKSYETIKCRKWKENAAERIKLQQSDAKKKWTKKEKKMGMVRGESETNHF